MAPLYLLGFLPSEESLVFSLDCEFAEGSVRPSVRLSVRVFFGSVDFVHLAQPEPRAGTQQTAADLVDARAREEGDTQSRASVLCR